MARGASLGLSGLLFEIPSPDASESAGRLGRACRTALQHGPAWEVLTLRPGTSKQTVHSNTEAIYAVQAWELRLLAVAQASTAAPLPVDGISRSCWQGVEFRRDAVEREAEQHPALHPPS